MFSLRQGLKQLLKVKCNFCTEKGGVNERIRVEYDDQELSETFNQQNISFREKNFVDRIRLTFQAGNGGNGCVSNFRSRTIKTGAPDGGDGGKGGDLILRSTSFFNDLRIFRRKLVQGNNGKNGSKQKQDGRNGNDIKVSVPQGTLVYQILGDIEQQNQTKNLKKDYYKRFLIDLSEEGQEYCVVQGGQGGKGNGKHLYVKTTQKGILGQRKDILLELKCIADVGLVGFPNAGKSTLLASVSRQLPKIANYPFTTLNPLIGKIKFVDEFEFTMSDIPGIIENSHLNKGLGLDFLRHIERTKVLIFVLDLQDEEPWKTLEILRRELLMYRPDFLERPAFVVANKADLDEQAEGKFKQLQTKTEYKCFLISAKHAYGIGEVVLNCRSILTEMRSNQIKEI